MVTYKVNVAEKGITKKYETSNEDLVGTKIKDKIDGKLVSEELEGYELEITGTSDKAGFPGFEEYNTPGLKKILLKYGKGMHKKPKGLKKVNQKPKGLRLRKTIRGNEISLDTIQINTKVIKQGKTKFEDLQKKEEQPAENPEENKE
jgi:small subunit ribosomal protein S6e